MCIKCTSNWLRTSCTKCARKVYESIIASTLTIAIFYTKLNQLDTASIKSIDVVFIFLYTYRRKNSTANTDIWT